MISVFRAIFHKTFNFILAPLRYTAGFLRSVIPGLKWFAGLKPEILAALLTFIFLLVIWIITRFASGDANADRTTQMRDWAITLSVIIAIPIVLYFFLRILFQPPKSPFPDIDESWLIGLKELEKNGLVIKDLPIYLVLGMRDSKNIRSFIEASGKQFDVDGVTGSGQSLIWYASKDHVFVFLANVGNFTEFTAKSQKLRMLHGAVEQDFTSTAHIGNFYQVPNQAMVDEPDDEVPIMSTVRASDLPPIGDRPTQAAVQTVQTEDQTEPERESSRAKSNEQRKRLHHLAALIRRTRNPVSPINGLLVDANVNLLESYPEEMARQLRDDLASLSSELRIICAVTMVVSGLESDRGFMSFAQRLIKENGPEFAKSKFGKSYRTWTAASIEQLEKVAQAAVEEFDSFVHLIFTKRDALSGEHVQGNRDLVLFMCRLYSTILPGLREVLGKGCGIPQNMNGEFPRFAGCYFVGNDQHHQYFLQKVFDRVEENQGELEWTGASLRREETWRLLTNLGYLVGLFSLIAFVFMMFYFNDLRLPAW